MQISRFTNGGFVIQKMTPHTTTGRCSAWFDADGRLLDAETFNRRDVARNVKRHGPTWRAIQAIGGSYVAAKGATVPA